MRAVLVAVILFVLASPAHAAVPRGFVGVVADDVFVGSDDYQRAQLDAMQRAGVTLVRRTFDWAEIERRPGVYDWSAYDRFVLRAAEYGVEVLPILFNPPRFLAAAQPKRYSPRLPRDFFAVAAFARAAIARYGPQGTLWAEHPDAPRLPVRAWQVWNEPNLAIYWPLTHSARDYSRMMAVVAAAIRDADPTAKIVSAGLPDSRRSSDWAIPLGRYVKDLIREGLGPSIDVLAVNAYADDADGVVAIVRRVRRLLDRRGLSRIRLQVTEFGWSTGGPASAYRTSARGQARNIRATVRSFAAQRGKLRLDGFVYYAWRDARPYAGGKDFWGLYTGLLNRAGQRKRGYRALVGAVRAINAPG